MFLFSRVWSVAYVFVMISTYVLSYANVFIFVWWKDNKETGVTGSVWQLRSPLLSRVAPETQLISDRPGHSVPFVLEEYKRLFKVEMLTLDSLSCKNTQDHQVLFQGIAPCTNRC